jgi:hypothetical protein
LLLSNQTYSFPTQPLQLAGLFADSLPDGWGMLLMDRYFKKYQGREPYQIHPFERLAFLGEHTMGALSYMPTMDIDGQTAALNFFDLPMLLCRYNKIKIPKYSPNWHSLADHLKELGQKHWYITNP